MLGGVIFWGGVRGRACVVAIGDGWLLMWFVRWGVGYMGDLGCSCVLGGSVDVASVGV